MDKDTSSQPDVIDSTVIPLDGYCSAISATKSYSAMHSHSRVHSNGIGSNVRIEDKSSLGENTSSSDLEDWAFVDALVEHSRSSKENPMHSNQAIGLHIKVEESSKMHVASCTKGLHASSKPVPHTTILEDDDDDWAIADALVEQSRNSKSFPQTVVMASTSTPIPTANVHKPNASRKDISPGEESDDWALADALVDQHIMQSQRGGELKSTITRSLNISDSNRSTSASAHVRVSAPLIVTDAINNHSKTIKSTEAHDSDDDWDEAAVAFLSQIESKHEERALKARIVHSETKTNGEVIKL